MRSLVHLAGRESSHSSQAGEVPTRGVVALLSSVGVCAATFAVAAASVLGASSNWSLLAVLATDCVLNLIKCVPPLIRYGAAAAEAEHRRAVAVLEERQASPGADEEEFGQVEREIEARESAIASRLTSLETVVFATELIDLALSSGHFLHLWSIHGTHFGIVDGVIALHFHSSVTAIGRKVGSDFYITHLYSALLSYIDHEIRFPKGGTFTTSRASSTRTSRTPPSSRFARPPRPATSAAYASAGWGLAG